MKLIISETIRAKYPDLRIAVVVAKNINNTLYQNGLEDFTNDTFKAFAQKFGNHKDFETHKNIVAWREIYRSFGVNPKKKKPTAESLLVRVIRSGYAPKISPAVDAYLCAETVHYLPIGGYDLDKITGDIVLRFSEGNEKFLGIGAESEEVTDTSEVVYSDNNHVLTRCWNYRDCDFSKIDKETTTLALFSEAPYATISDNEAKETVNSIKENLQKFCGAECTTFFLSSKENEIGIF
ncbi:MAG: phenylalanine--tRNA ligase beta subunit-related protein [Defluviitaleaceae bacterium]|nr:phenylalanine--tRNA ligase beta subunit-related protein [Defluviitaleaceae bacterium]